MANKTPKWTVVYNIVSVQSQFIGTGWEFFMLESNAKHCYGKQVAAGNCPTMRPFHEATDRQHMGAVHQ